MQNVEKSGLSACIRKYSKEELGAVAKIKILPKKDTKKNWYKTMKEKLINIFFFWLYSLKYKFISSKF